MKSISEVLDNDALWEEIASLPFPESLQLVRQEFSKAFMTNDTVVQKINKEAYTVSQTCSGFNMIRVCGLRVYHHRCCGYVGELCRLGQGEWDVYDERGEWDVYDERGEAGGTVAQDLTSLRDALRLLITHHALHRCNP